MDVRYRVSLLLVGHTVGVHFVEPPHLLHGVLRGHHTSSVLHFRLAILNKVDAEL